MTLSAIDKLKKAAAQPGQTKLSVSGFPKPVQQARVWLEKNGRKIDGDGVQALPKDLANKVASNMMTDRSSAQAGQATYKDSRMLN